MRPRIGVGWLGCFLAAGACAAARIGAEGALRSQARRVAVLQQDVSRLRREALQARAAAAVFLSAEALEAWMASRGWRESSPAEPVLAEGATHPAPDSG